MVSEEQGRVVGMENGVAMVELDPQERCAGCGLCAASEGKMRLTLDAVEGLKPGQVVIVGIDRSRFLRSLFLLFGLPLIGLVAGAVLGAAHPIPGMTGDASAAVLAVVLLVAAFLVALLYDRKVAAKAMPQPTILRIESE